MAVTNLIYSQNPATVDLTFNNPNEAGFTGTTDVINSILVSDSKIYLGGSFSSYFGTPVNNILSINSKGGIDTSFMNGTGFNNSVICLEKSLDNKIIIGGNFNNYNGVVANRIIALNLDGSINNTFDFGTGFNGDVNTIAVQTDGKLIIGGDFSSFNGVSANKIIRLNNDGTIDSNFSTGTGFNNIVKTIAIQSDGKILVGGTFTTYNGISKNRIVRLNNDGTIDNSYQTSIGFNNSVNDIKILLDGNAIIGGSFTTYSENQNGNPFPASRIIILNTSGDKIDSFGSGFNSTVNAIHLRYDNKILISGDFTQFQGISTNKIIRLNADNTHDTSFNLGYTIDNSIYAVSNFGNRTLIGGNFNSINTTVSGDINSNRIRMLDDDGSFTNDFASKIGIYPNSSVPNHVTEIAIKSNGKIIVGGNSESYNNATANRIVQLNADGSIDATFSSGLGFTGPFSQIREIVPQPDGKVLVGGTFTYYNDVYTDKHLIRLNSDGSVDNTFTLNSLQDNSEYFIYLQDNGKIILGEKNYSYYNFVPEARLIRLNSDGTLDSSFNIGKFDLGITSIVEQSDGKLLVSGNFSAFNGTNVNRVVRLNSNGSLDNSFSTGSGFDNIVYNLAIQSNGKILVGGNFTTYDNLNANRIVRLNSDGSIDNNFITSGTGFDRSISEIKILSDNKILVCGSFTNYNGTTANNLIKLNIDGSIDNSFQTSASPNNDTLNSSYIADIEIDNNGKILICGSHFTNIDNIRRSLARLIGGTTALSINENYLTENLSIYPNPTNNIIRINNSNLINLNYVIYDLKGVKIKTGKQENGLIDVTDLKTDIYILQLKSKNKIYSAKFIKR